MPAHLPMTIRQADAQQRLRGALNDWIETPAARVGVMAALADGARLDLPSAPAQPHSLLHLCCQVIVDAQEWKELSSFIRASSPRLETRARDGSTPWISAAASSNPHALRALSVLGANTHAQDGRGLSAIHRLCSMQEADADARPQDCLRILLDDWPACAGLVVHAEAERFAGADIEDPKLWDPEALMAGAPIHFACRGGLWPAARLLMEAGADLDAREPVSGLRPIDLALQKNFESMAVELAATCPSVEADEQGACHLSPLWASLRRGWPKAAQALLSRGACSARALDRSGGSTRMLLDQPADAAAAGPALVFWKGYKAMVADERAMGEALRPGSPERVDKLVRRALRM